MRSGPVNRSRQGHPSSRWTLIIIEMDCGVVGVSTSFYGIRTNRWGCGDGHINHRLLSHLWPIKDGSNGDCCASTLLHSIIRVGNSVNDDEVELTHSSSFICGIKPINKSVLEGGSLIRSFKR